MTEGFLFKQCIHLCFEVKTNVKIDYFCINICIMTEIMIREKLAKFCLNGDMKKVKAILTILEQDINEYTHLGENFISELDRRQASFLNETATTYTWEETKHAALEKAKA